MARGNQLRVRHSEILMLRAHGDEASSIERRRELQIDQGVAAARADMTLGAVRVQVGTNACRQIRAFVQGIYEFSNLFRSPAQRLIVRWPLALLVFDSVKRSRQEGQIDRFL